MRPGEIKALLQKIGKTEEEMNFMWESCVVMGKSTTSVVKNLANHGLTWKDLNSIAAESLLSTYENMLEEEGLNGDQDKTTT